MTPEEIARRTEFVDELRRWQRTYRDTIGGTPTITDLAIAERIAALIAFVMST